MSTLLKRNIPSFILLAILFAGCISIPSAAIRQEDLFGVWFADYSQYHTIYSSTFAPMDFTEKIVLKSDSTYQQFVDAEEVAAGSWRYDSSTGAVFLDGAMILNEGKLAAEQFASGQRGGMFIGCDNGLVEVDGSELILCATHDERLGIVLNHLGIGDPDSPFVITLNRETD